MTVDFKNRFLNEFGNTEQTLKMIDWIAKEYTPEIQTELNELILGAWEQFAHYYKDDMSDGYDNSCLGALENIEEYLLDRKLIDERTKAPIEEEKP